MPLQRPVRLAICAEPFGFGPASKAAAVLDCIQARATAVPTIFATSVAAEYFDNHGYGSTVALDPRNPNNHADINNKLKDVDAAIVSVDMAWVKFIAASLPIFFLDSLGFMWDRGLFAEIPQLLDVNAYFAQDVFGAAQRIRSFGVKNLVPVGAIISRYDRPASEKFQHEGLAFPYVVTLGGLKSHMQGRDPSGYVEFVAQVIASIVPDGENIALLCGRSSGIESTKVGRISVLSVSHRQAWAMYRSAKAVFASPGLTTLLEMADEQIPTVPLPPQNLSQALILHHMAKDYPALPRIYKFLADQYPVMPGTDERAGIELVEQRHRALLPTASFHDQLAPLIREAVDARLSIPGDIVPNYDGADAVASAVLRSVPNLGTYSTKDDNDGPKRWTT